VSPYQDKLKCSNCNTCIVVCPEKAITTKTKNLVFDYKKCIRCYCCSELCPEGAIDLKYSGIGNLIFKQKPLK
jgi:Fe-S-cluster-containing hydrogenase component 2